MLSLFLPALCVHCSAPAAKDSATHSDIPLTRYLCSVCLDFLAKSTGPPLAQSLDLIQRTGSHASFDNAFCATSFIQESPIQSVIHSFKYGEMPNLARQIGRLIGERSPDLRANFDLLLPVPLHRTRFAERGYNQAELLAQGISEVLSIEVAKRTMVRRIRPTPTQTTLDVHQRLENVRGAFAVSKQALETLHAKRILIVDDVMTTGATIASVAEALLPIQPALLGFTTFAAVTI